MTSLLIVGSLLAAGGVFIRRPQFGRIPSGERLSNLRQSTHYHNGGFRNLLPTPMIKEGVSVFSVLKKSLSERSKRGVPPSRLPSHKIDLFALDPAEDVIVWFGHSSYYMQIGGKKFLVDPVLSGNASPVMYTAKSFKGSDVYTPADIPPIDVLLITHDHWDHLDYDTLTQLRPKIKKIITGLGVGAHLEHWGFASSIICEKDWNESVDLGNGFRIVVTPARHFSGRSITRNKTLWVSFVLKTPHRTIFMSGDGGYGPHFEAIGREHGPFDLAMLECGQYNESWKYIHMNPEETVRAAMDLGAKRFIPIHWAKFRLALHAWDEPIARVTSESRHHKIPIIHPMIGQKLHLDDPIVSRSWWEEVH